MKHFSQLLFALLFITFAASAEAQLRKIPATVTERFQQKYPMATSIEWRDKLTSFSADFKLNDSTYTANFTNEGEWSSTETTISESDLPQAVRDSYTKSKYNDWEIGLIQRIETAGNPYQYRVQAIKSELRKRNLYFTSEGRMIRDLLTL